MWHIKKLIKQHDHYIGAPCAGMIKGHSKICSFVTQHNATDVSSFEGACILQECPPELLPENWMFVSLPWSTNVVLDNLAVRPTGLRTADHVQPWQPKTSTSGFFTCGIVWDQPPGQLMKLGLHNQIIFPKTVRNRLRESSTHHPHQGPDLTAVRQRNRL
jgi:hypothetical protein